MSVSIVILQYGKSEYTQQCLISLIENGLSSHVKNIYIIDNNSEDVSCVQSIEELRSLDDRIRIKINKKNLGFGLAHNKIIEEISDEFVLLINNDTLIIDDSIDRLISTCVENREKVATGVLLNKDFTLQPNTNGYFGFPAPVRRYFKKVSKEKRVVPYCNGALLWIKRSVFNEVGGFSPSYFMYNEDLDLMIKLNKKKYWVTQYLIFKIIHYGGTSGEELWNVNDKLKLQIMQGNKILKSHYSAIGLLFFDFTYLVSGSFKSLLCLVKLDIFLLRSVVKKMWWKVTL